MENEYWSGEQIVMEHHIGLIYLAVEVIAVIVGIWVTYKFLRVIYKSLKRRAVEEK
jgi:hypothetical protein